jgi:antibiotic biosynthesis monooxygenase (ABM) superfamily enzyme
MAQDVKTSTKDPVTMIVRRSVKAGREADYEQWVTATTQDLKTFPGYMDITMIKPQISAQNKNKSKEYTLIIRFDTYEHVENWENSAIRNSWIEKAKNFTENVSNQKVTGLEYWFPLPEIPKALVPPRYKMALVTICAIYPVSLLVNFLFGFIPFHFPMLLRSLLVTIVLVSTMTYLVMPMVTSFLRGWLFKQPK